MVVVLSRGTADFDCPIFQPITGKFNFYWNAFLGANVDSLWVDYLFVVGSLVA